MEQRIAEAMQAALGDQGKQPGTLDHSQHTNITFNGDITIQVSVLKKQPNVTKR
jgi:hypothetical protein